MSNASGGAAPFQVSETAKLLAKDPSRAMDLLQSMLNRLKDKELDGLIDEIEQKIKALKDSADKIGKVAEKISELMPDAIGGEGSSLAALVDGITKGSAGAESLAMYLLTRIAEMNEDDLHDMLDELERVKRRRAGRRRLAGAGGATALLVGLGLFVGPRIIPPKDASTETPVPTAIVAVAPLPALASECSLRFIKPTSSEETPLSGPLSIGWSSVGPAASYALEVMPPGGSGAPWNISTDETSKNIFMENFPAGGEYQISVSALDATGAVLCTGVMSFHKGELGESPTRKKQDGRGKDCVPYGMMAC